jgi:hypothetical protein
MANIQSVFQPTCRCTMFPPRWFIPYDALFQLITAFVALAVAMYALRGHQWVKERTLYALFLAFLLLSTGLFINSITLAYTYLSGISFSASSDPLSVADIGFWAHYVMSMFAYSLLLFAYTFRLRESSAMLAGGLVLLAVGGGGGNGGGAAGGSLLMAGPVVEMYLVILLLIIVISQLAHLMVRRSRYSIMVTFSFLLILISHILIMFSSLEDITYVVGRLLELAGFISLFGMLYSLRRTG